MRYIKTNVKYENFTTDMLKKICETVNETIPTGEGKAHPLMQDWEGFDEYLDKIYFPHQWFSPDKWRWIKKSLGTLGGGK